VKTRWCGREAATRSEEDGQLLPDDRSSGKKKLDPSVRHRNLDLDLDQDQDQTKGSIFALLLFPESDGVDVSL
jgi:hypothetical protein